MSRPLMPAPPTHVRRTPGPPVDLLARVAQRLREVKPLDEILDDIGDVLGNQAPPAAECEDLDQRLRADLIRLTRIALAARDEDPEVSALLQRTDRLLAEDVPADYQLTLGSLRRMASTANDLLERLTETGSIKEVA
ncbi:DUF6415 family natural product biosynthesis protein (plasmid) [Streptomyces sp. NBC_01241]|uniref:DUF6415 family natural product biosynthesis protein n=1 Tax=Streptomyces sp. NBC_01241 TaxID=2903794 RepID=UPI00352CE80A|nr:DUF6415 family natural product biosynthesis protein [Streptomyces sp. NBC_01241]